MAVQEVEGICALAVLKMSSTKESGYSQDVVRFFASLSR